MRLSTHSKDILVSTSSSLSARCPASPGFAATEGPHGVRSPPAAVGPSVHCCVPGTCCCSRFPPSLLNKTKQISSPAPPQPCPAGSPASYRGAGFCFRPLERCRSHTGKAVQCVVTAISKAMFQVFFSFYIKAISSCHQQASCPRTSCHRQRNSSFFPDFSFNPISRHWGCSSWRLKCLWVRGRVLCQPPDGGGELICTP